jgi:Flp pilus assembly protein TadB
MKIDEDFPKDWQIIIFAAILFFLALQACTTTKQVNQVKQTEETKLKSSEETKTTVQSETKTKTIATAETVTVEECDTAVMVWVMAGDTNPIIKQILVPVKFKRTINKTEVINQQQENKQQEAAVVTKKEQLNTKTELTAKDKTVERTGLPWWGIAIIVVFILAAIAILLYRRKVF